MKEWYVTVTETKVSTYKVRADTREAAKQQVKEPNRALHRSDRVRISALSLGEVTDG